MLAFLFCFSILSQIAAVSDVLEITVHLWLSQDGLSPTNSSEQVKGGVKPFLQCTVLPSLICQTISCCYQGSEGLSIKLF